MTTKEILYSLEHDLLPKSFFDDRKTFAGVLAQDPGALYEIASELFRRNGQDNPFSRGEFSVEPNMINSEVAMLRLRFPKPPEAPLCSTAFIFFDRTFEKISYFCIEKGNEFTGGFPNVCEWQADGTHVAYGSQSPDPDEQMMKCVEIHLERYYGKEEE